MAGMNDPEYNQLSERMAVAREAAERAGKTTLKYFQTDCSRETKADGTVVTIADKQSEKQIRRAIQKAFPKDGILGEEFEEKKGETRWRWIIDPIDGTLSYAQGVPLYGVLIGVEDQETRMCPVGVIHVPALGETVHAQRGRGCFWQRVRGRSRVSEPARVSRVDRLEDAVLLSTDFWHSPVEGRREALARLAARTRVQRTWADCYGYVLVATGRAELMLDTVMKVWDCAPLQPILEEAGGTFTDWSGTRTIYGACGLATNGVLFRQALELLQASPAAG